MARILDKPDFFQVLFQSIGLMKKSGVRLFDLHVNLLTTLSLVFWAYETKRVLCKYIGCSLGIRDRRILHWLHRILRLKVHSLWLLLEFLMKTLSIYTVPHCCSHDKNVDTHLYTSLFQPLIRWWKLGKWINTLAKQLRKLANRTLAKRLCGQDHYP